MEQAIEDEFEGFAGSGEAASAGAGADALCGSDDADVALQAARKPMAASMKLWCRAFQKAFHLAIPLLPYRKPVIVHSLGDLPSVVRSEGCGRVLVVTDPGVAKLGLAEPMLRAFEGADVPFAVYDRTVPNPTTATVEEALALYRAEGCDCIVGFGGGSSMDCAKAVAVRAAKPNKTLGQLKGILRVRTKLPLLMAVPTTAGTGSETTLAAVITDAETRHKYAINDFPLIPRYAVLDPAVTLSLPPALTASTGMDALTHAVEAYIGRSTTKDTRADALEAVRLIFANLDQAYRNGGDEQARRNMLRASFLAGCAFTKSYVGYVHAIAHSLGGRYNVPHGYANAVILPLMLRRYGKSAERPLADLARAAAVATERDGDERAARAFVRAVTEMKHRFAIGDTFPELRREDIPELARTAAAEANPLYPVPLLLSAEQLEEVYEQLLDPQAA